jgi:cell division septal protein FtsQ
MTTARRTSVLFALSLGTLAACIVLANIWKTRLVVQHVTVTGNRIVDTNEILQLAQLEPGTRMYDVDLMALQRNLLSHHFLKSATVERDLPSTLHIHVAERVPVAMIHRGDILYVDQDGVLLPHAAPGELFDLPIITGMDPRLPLTIGTQITDPDLQEALSILSMARIITRDMYHQISEVHLRGGGDLVLYAAEGGLPILFGRGAAARKFASLESFWAEVVRERGSQDLEYIDLRFEDQVVVRWGRHQPRQRQAS